jgi:hypothetical protein
MPDKPVIGNGSALFLPFKLARGFGAKIEGLSHHSGDMDEN